MKHDDDADDGENNLASLLVFVRVENTMHVRHTSRTFQRQNQNYRPIIKAMAHDELKNIFISENSVPAISLSLRSISSFDIVVVVSAW